MNTEKTMAVATTIRNQVGAVALAMMGACNMLGGEDSLQFKIKGSPKGVNHVVIKLAADDTYTVQFWNIRGRGHGMKMLEEVEQVYADSLRATLAAHTGLYTSL